MRVQVSEAAPSVLNHFAALRLGQPAGTRYSDDPARCAPLLAHLRRHRLTLQEDRERGSGFWTATLAEPFIVCHGHNAETAVLRCYLTLVQGNTLELPESLIADQLACRALWSSSARCGE